MSKKTKKKKMKRNSSGRLTESTHKSICIFVIDVITIIKSNQIVY